MSQADPARPVLVPDAEPTPAPPSPASSVTLIVTLEAPDLTRTEHRVTTDARDHRGYARLRHRYDLPTIDLSTGAAGPDGILLMTFCAWHALHVRADPPAVPHDWPRFDAEAIGLDLVAVEPTPPTAPGSGVT